MKYFCTVLSCFLLLTVSCSDHDKKPVNSNCDNNAQIVSQAIFENVNTANYTITNVALNQDCIDITISSSGCSGETWQMNLFSTSEFSSTAIPQKQLKIGLTNTELCAAVISKTVSFSLIPYQLNGQDEITLFIEGWATPISYTY